MTMLAVETQFLTMTWTMCCMNRNQLRVRKEKKSRAAFYIKLRIIYEMKCSDMKWIVCLLNRSRMSANNGKTRKRSFSFSSIQIDCNNVFVQFITSLYHLFQRTLYVMLQSWHDSTSFNSTRRNGVLWWKMKKKVNHTRRVSHARTLYGIECCTV